MKVKVLRKEDLEKKVCVVVGTRPGIIKMAPIVGELERKGIDHFVLHTGQHYSYSMDRKFFEELGLEEPRAKLEVVKRFHTHGGQTAEMIKGSEEVLLKERPRIVLVCGDANTNLSGALAARKLGIAVGHVEAGLRSGDWRMPEEHNRVMIDHISEYLFAPTEQARQNLIMDGVKGEIMVTGNTVVDAVYEHLELAKQRSKALDILKLDQDGYFVVTAHREENVDNRESLKNILKAMGLITGELGMEMVFPIHPRTKERIRDFGLEEMARSVRRLRIIEPVGYLDFLLLLSHCRLVLTDSGGIQEESCVLKVPCITLRETTERPETVEVGANVVAGLQPQKILQCATTMLSKKRDWRNPFGDGKAAARIVASLQHEVCQ